MDNNNCQFSPFFGSIQGDTYVNTDTQSDCITPISVEFHTALHGVTHSTETAHSLKHAEMHAPLISLWKQDKDMCTHPPTNTPTPSCPFSPFTHTELQS